MFNVLIIINIISSLTCVSYLDKNLINKVLLVRFSPAFSAWRQQKQRSNHSTQSLYLPRRRPRPLPACSANGLPASLPADQSAVSSEFLSTNGEVKLFSCFYYLKKKISNSKGCFSILCWPLLNYRIAKTN